MKRALLCVAALAFSSIPALADDRTIEVDIASGFVRSIVSGRVDTPAPAGMTFIVISDDSFACQAGWIFNLVNYTCASTPK